MKMLPGVLSLIAGSVDVIGFLRLDGLFTAHITGNLIVVSARLFVGEPARLAHLIAVPVFVVVLALVKLFAVVLERVGIPSLRPLLLLQFLLLGAFLGACVAAGSHADPDSTVMILAGMLGVAAMAVQNALVRVALTGAPSTAVMTTNVTLLTLDVGELLLGYDPASVAKARQRARNTWPAVAGFLVGCALGACCDAALGRGSGALPAGLALVALALSAAPQCGLRRESATEP